MPVSVVCGECKKEFEVKPYQVGSRIWCSVACKNAASRVGRICQHCAKEFWIFKSQERKGLGQFCSKACKDLSRTFPKPDPKPKKEPAAIICVHCKEAFKVPFCRGLTAIYCSAKCKYASEQFRKGQSDYRIGEKSLRWKGGTYKMHSGYVRVKSKRLDVETVNMQHRVVMIEWMLEVDKTTDFLVLLEGKIRLHPDIEVHHIDRNRSNNVRENLLAVTRAAHAKIHNHGTKPKPFECWPPDPQKW